MNTLSYVIRTQLWDLEVDDLVDIPLAVNEVLPEMLGLIHIIRDALLDDDA